MQGPSCTLNVPHAAGGLMPCSLLWPLPCAAPAPHVSPSPLPLPCRWALLPLHCPNCASSKAPSYTWWAARVRAAFPLLCCPAQRLAATAALGTVGGVAARQEPAYHNFSPLRLNVAHRSPPRQPWLEFLVDKLSNSQIIEDLYKIIVELYTYKL